VSSSYRQDILCVITAAFAGVKLPAAIADYIQCIGPSISDGVPIFLSHRVNTQNSGSNFSLIAMPGTVGSWTGGVAKPFVTSQLNAFALNNSAAFTVSIDNNPTYGSAAYVTALKALQSAHANNILQFPMYKSSVFIREVSASFALAIGGADRLVSRHIGGCFGGLCTHSIAVLNRVDDGANTSYTLVGATQIYPSQTLQLRSLSSSVPLVGSTLTRAIMGAFIGTFDGSAITSTTQCKFEFEPEDPEIMRTWENSLFNETTQFDGSFQLELAKIRGKRATKPVAVPGAVISAVSESKDEASPLIDRVTANLASVYAENASVVQDLVIQVQDKAYELVSDAGSQVVSYAVKAMLGTITAAL
jgi:hypothetical protein